MKKLTFITLLALTSCVKSYNCCVTSEITDASPNIEYLNGLTTWCSKHRITSEDAKQIEQDGQQFIEETEIDYSYTQNITTICTKD